MVSDRPLRIAHVVNEPFGHESASGVQQVIHWLAEAQAQVGQSVAVFSRDSGGMRELGPQGENRAGVPPNGPDAPAGTRGDLLVGRYREPRLEADVLAWQPDIVHFHSIHIPQNVALASCLRRAAIPYCVTIHGGLFPAALRRGRLKKLAFRHLFERAYLNGSRFVHAVSPHEVAVIRGYGVERPVVVVPNGVPPGADACAPDPGALFVAHPALRDMLVFLFVGRLDTWQKGLDLLVDAFARARLSGAALVLAGPDWRGSQQTLAARADRLGIRPRVVFTGPAFGADRANLFAAADVFVHPSRWEGLSLSVLAAAAAGKPCLITREADLYGELERTGGALIVQPDADSIAAGLRQAAVGGRGVLQSMGARARAAAEARFAWDAIAGELVQAYRTAVGEPQYAGAAPAARPQAVRTG